MRQLGTQEWESEGGAQAMSSQAQPFLPWVGIALSMAAAVGAVHDILDNPHVRES